MCKKYSDRPTNSFGFGPFRSLVSECVHTYTFKWIGFDALYARNISNARSIEIFFYHLCYAVHDHFVFVCVLSLRLDTIRSTLHKEFLYEAQSFSEIVIVSSLKILLVTYIFYEFVALKTTTKKKTESHSHHTNR